MKFGKRLQAQHYLKWENHYINYKMLKKVLKKTPQDDTNAFIFALDCELEKVKSFYTRKIDEFEDRLRRLCKRTSICLVSPRVDSTIAKSLLAAFNAFLNDINMLKEFANLNCIGFGKILKKHDKVLCQKIQKLYLSSKVLVAPFSTDAKTLQDMTETVEQNIEKLSACVNQALALGPNLTGDNASQLLDAVASQDQSRMKDAIIAITTDGSQVANHETVTLLTGPAFMLACKQGYVELVEALLDSGHVDINFADPVNNRTGLHKAAAYGHWPVLRLLLERGADPQNRDGSGRLPLHLAAIRGCCVCVQALLQVTDSPDYPDNEGHTALFYAIVQGATDCVAALNRAGAEGDCATGVLKSSALHVAAEYGRTPIVEILLGQDIATDSLDENGCTPLHLAARGGHFNCIRLLAEKGASLEVAEHHSKWTPLFEAASEGHLKSVQALLDHGADPSTPDHMGWQAQVHALYRGHVEIAHVLKAATQTRAMEALTSLGPTTGANQPSLSTPPLLIPAGNATMPVINAITKNLQISTQPPLAQAKQQAAIPPFSLPPPALPFRHYGHAYLKGKCQLIVSLGGSDVPVPFSQTPEIDKPQPPSPSLGLQQALRRPASSSTPIVFSSSRLNFLSLSLAISLLGSEMDQHLVPMPVQDYLEMYSFYADTPDDFTVQFDIFPTFSNRHTQPIARAVVLPSEFKSLKGVMTAPLLDSHLSVVGMLTFTYTLIKPLDQPVSPRALTYWKATQVLAKHDLPTAYIPHTANALLVKETSLDARYICFSLQMTKDSVPVISDSPNVCLTPGPGLPPIVLPISMLTSEQYKAVMQGKADSGRCREPLLFLSHAIQDVPPYIGFMIRLDVDADTEGQGLSFNAKVDTVLSCVYAHSHSRPILFLSANPDMCLYLTRKQPNYPVFLSTAAGETGKADPRTNSIQRAVRFAKNNSLLGIKVPAAVLQDAPLLINVIKESGLLVFTGTRTDSPDALSVSVAQQVDGVVLRNIAYVGHPAHDGDELYRLYAEALSIDAECPVHELVAAPVAASRSATNKTGPSAAEIVTSDAFENAAEWPKHDDGESSAGDDGKVMQRRDNSSIFAFLSS